MSEVPGDLPPVDSPGETAFVEETVKAVQDVVESLQSWLNDSLQPWLEPLTGTKSAEAGSETEQERQQKIIQEVLNLMSYWLSLPVSGHSCSSLPRRGPPYSHCPAVILL